MPLDPTPRAGQVRAELRRIEAIGRPCEHVAVCVLRVDLVAARAQRVHVLVDGGARDAEALGEMLPGHRPARAAEPRENAIRR
jgi:hypothetical protein